MASCVLKMVRSCRGSREDLCTDRGVALIYRESWFLRCSIMLRRERCFYEMLRRQGFRYLDDQGFR